MDIEDELKVVGQNQQTLEVMMLSELSNAMHFSLTTAYHSIAAMYYWQYSFPGWQKCITWSQQQ